jgi:hypothetical protein
MKMLPQYFCYYKFASSPCSPFSARLHFIASTGKKSKAYVCAYWASRIQPLNLFISIRRRRPDSRPVGVTLGKNPSVLTQQGPLRGLHGQAERAQSRAKSLAPARNWTPIASPQLSHNTYCCWQGRDEKFRRIHCSEVAPAMYGKIILKRMLIKEDRRV